MRPCRVRVPAPGDAGHEHGGKKRQQAADHGGRGLGERAGPCLVDAVECAFLQPIEPTGVARQRVDRRHRTGKSGKGQEDEARRDGMQVGRRSRVPSPMAEPEMKADGKMAPDDDQQQGLQDHGRRIDQPHAGDDEWIIGGDAGGARYDAGKGHVANEDERDHEGEEQARPFPGGKAQVAASIDGIVGKSQMDDERPGQRRACDRVAPQQAEQPPCPLRRLQRPQPKGMIEGVGENETGDDQAGGDVDFVEVHGLAGTLSPQARGPWPATRATPDGAHPAETAPG